MYNFKVYTIQTSYLEGRIVLGFISISQFLRLHTEPIKHRRSRDERHNIWTDKKDNHIVKRATKNDDTYVISAASYSSSCESWWRPWAGPRAIQALSDASSLPRNAGPPGQIFWGPNESWGPHFLPPTCWRGLPWRLKLNRWWHPCCMLRRVWSESIASVTNAHNSISVDALSNPRTHRMFSYTDWYIEYF